MMMALLRVLAFSLAAVGSVGKKASVPQVPFDLRSNYDF
jgi:hypothetical protein